MARKKINTHVKLGTAVKIWHNSNIYGTANALVHIGDYTQIGSFCEIKPGTTIGKRCRVQSYVFISNHTKIGDDVFIGPHASFLNDKYPTAKAARNKSWQLSPVVVKRGATIGGGAIIGPGVTIGTSAVIGMGAVVAKNVASHEIVAGNPACVIGHTTDPKYFNSF